MITKRGSKDTTDLGDQEDRNNLRSLRRSPKVPKAAKKLQHRPVQLPPSNTEFYKRKRKKQIKSGLPAVEDIISSVDNKDKQRLKTKEQKLRYFSDKF